MTKTETILEIIATSVADAIEAERGGANRLEIVRDLRLGGLTPELELVSEIKNSVSIPLRVMLRESTGYVTSSEAEVERLCEAAARFATLGVDGFVIGFLNQGTIDVELTQRILECAPRIKATFHHAFEDAKDKSQAIEAIRSISQVDRILSHGGVGELSERVQRLASYAQLAGSGLKILAGGGIGAEAIKRIGLETTIREFHVGRGARVDLSVEGSVDAKLVSALIRTLPKVSTTSR